MSISISEIESEMKQRIAATEKEYGTIRAGRPTKTLFANITVQHYGAPVPITHVATISIPEARQVIIKPWDPNVIDDIMKAVLSSELSLNPESDGKLIRIHFPPLSEERRHEYVKLAKNIAEKSKIAIRNIRRDANEHLKKELKAKELSEDAERDLLDEVQNLTDRYIHKIDELSAQKEREIIDN